MPFCRGVYLNHPTTGEYGLWIEVSVDSPGTLRGEARTAWPAVGAQTLAQYQAGLNVVYRDFCSLPGVPNNLRFGQQPPAGWYVGGDGQLYPMVVQVSIILSSLTPVTISDVTVSNGAMTLFKV